MVLFNHALLIMTTLSLGGRSHFILHFLCMSQWRSWLESIGILLFCLWNYPRLMAGFYSPLYLITCLGSMEDCPSKALFFLPLPTAFCPRFLLTCTFWTLFFSFSSTYPLNQWSLEFYPFVYTIQLHIWFASLALNLHLWQHGIHFIFPGRYSEWQPLFPLTCS